METQGTLNVGQPCDRLLSAVKNAEQVLLLVEELEAADIVVSVVETI